MAKENAMDKKTTAMPVLDVPENVKISARGAKHDGIYNAVTERLKHHESGMIPVNDLTDGQIAGLTWSLTMKKKLCSKAVRRVFKGIDGVPDGVYIVFYK